MRCEQVSELMSLQLDEQLARDETETLNRHLASCGLCQREWTALQSVSRLLARPAMALPPPDFTARVMTRVAAREAQSRWWQVLMGVVALVVGGLLFGSVLMGPFAVSVWTLVREPAASTWRGIEWLVAAGDTVLHARALVGVFWEVVLRLVNLAPFPLLAAYAVTALMMVTIWVAIVGHLRLRGTETTLRS